MCGISGVVSIGKNLDLNETILAMNKMIVHRGPDGSGVYVNKDYGIGLGHMRLSIIDLSISANQPMSFRDLYKIVYNGEIFNYIEIKNELIKNGYSFTTSSDTEVLIAAYDFWDIECFNKFNGMWALCIYDIKKHKLILSRDRFGVKPLYYFKSNDFFLFASEIKQISTIIGKTNLNQSIFHDFLFFDFINHNEQTFYENILKLMPGCIGTYCLTSHHFQIDKYFVLTKDNNMEGMSLDEKGKYYINLLADSVKLRLRSDVKVGTCLSGGLDSSYIAALAATNNESLKNLIAITAKSTEKKSDESGYAEIVASKFGFEHIIITPSVKDYEDSLNEIVNNQDEPFGGPSIVMQFLVMKAAKENGCKVMLDGQGGDETLLGYERYYFQTMQNQSLFKQLRNFLLISKNSKLSFFDVIKYNYFFSNVKLNNLVLKNRFSFLKKNNIDCSVYNKYNFHTGSVFDLQNREIENKLLPLLHYEDKNSMYHSVEARLPFLDYRVVMAALTLPIDLKINNGWTKYLLRKSGDKLLPNEILWRKHKLGFEAPANTWMSNRDEIHYQILNDKFLQSIISEIPPNISTNILWRLYSFALWNKNAQVTC